MRCFLPGPLQRVLPVGRERSAAVAGLRYLGHVHIPGRGTLDTQPVILTVSTHSHTRDAFLQGGRTALMAACWKGGVSCTVDMLTGFVYHGSDINAVNLVCCTGWCFVYAYGETRSPREPNWGATGVVLV